MTRRRPDVVSLLAGIVFLGIGITVIAGRVGAFSDTRWVWPAVLVVVGVIMLGAVVGSSRRRHDTPHATPRDEQDASSWSPPSTSP
jgi:hypothetical protein